MNTYLFSFQHSFSFFLILTFFLFNLPVVISHKKKGMLKASWRNNLTDKHEKIRKEHFYFYFSNLLLLKKRSLSNLCFYFYHKTIHHKLHFPVVQK